MRTRSLSPIAIAVLAATFVAIGSTAFAQSPSQAPAPTTTSLCVDVYGPVPSQGWDPITLAAAVADHSVVIIAAGPCASPAPTTEPTTAPTPDPTPQPTAANDDQLIVTTIDDGVQRVFDWSNSVASMSTLRQLINAYVSIGTFAKQQVALSYTPSACMTDAWNSYRQGMSTLHGKIVAFLRWIVRTNGAGTPPKSIGDGFTQAGRLLGQARAEADSGSCTDSGVSG